MRAARPTAQSFARLFAGLCLSSALIPARPGPALAVFSSSDAGTSAGQFLTLGGSARAAAMGEAFSAAADDATSARYNPAAMIRVEGNSVSLMHLAGLQDSYLDNAAFVRRLTPSDAAGASFLYMNYGSIDRTDEVGAALGSTQPHDLAAALAYARQIQMNDAGVFDEGSVGLSLSLIQSKIVESAQTFAGTLGFLSRPFGSVRARFSFVGENLGGSLKFDQSSDPLPTAFKFGASLSPLAGLLASGEVALPRDSIPYGALGIEQRIGEAPGPALFLRAGLNTRTFSSLGGFSAFSTGFGIGISGVALDYAFVPFGDLGSTHRVSLSLAFGASPSDEAREEEPLESGWNAPPEGRETRSEKRKTDKAYYEEPIPFIH